MAGSTGSGQDIESGRANRAESRTAFWAQVPPGQSNFNGPAIVIVDVAEGPLEEEEYEPGENYTPSNTVHGLITIGFSGVTAGATGGMPAHGLIGRGGTDEGTGVLGVGGGTPSDNVNQRGDGGIGVHGVGGSRWGNYPGAIKPPGAGIVGQGGRQPDNDNRLRLPHAAGVIGLGGSKNHNTDTLAAHPIEETSGAGVYGKGADATLTWVIPLDANGDGTSGPQVSSGPIGPGPGVMGRGGFQDGNAAASAAGVIGLAGNSEMPKPTEMIGAGVYGRGMVGVLGTGSIGLLGRGIGGRGAMLESEKHPQAQLVPMRIQSPAELSDRCDPGDLLVTMALDAERGVELAALWFCKVGGAPDQAQWVQIG